MWILLITVLLLMSFLTIIQTPRSWFKNKIARLFLIIYHTIGILSIILILFVVYKMEDSLFREIIIWTETVYFTITIFGLVIAVFRFCAFHVARHFKHLKIINILKSRLIFLLVTVLVSFGYMVFSIGSALNIKATSYDITIDKSCDVTNLKIAVVADFHVGAGARHKELDKMAELIIQEKPDLILIAGDVCDSSSSVSDLEYVEKTLKKLKPKYGIFYAEGNHEKESRINPDKYLISAGVVILKDEATTLSIGLNIIGRKDNQKKDVETIIKETNLNTSHPTIILEHRPKNLHKFGDDVDLVLCGHTHGYQFPFMGILSPFTINMSYGLQKYGNTYALVTSGISEWGFRTKWPSQSEVAFLNLHLKEN